ncbi:MAG: hypothetical protein KC583_11660, partial [Myxococcales bacterium]|nr:hypothetical protein [Myxococcales bacterium]
RAATPVTPRCDADCEDPGGPDVTVDDPGVVSCPAWDSDEPVLCDTRAGFSCCLGQFTHCDRECTGVSVPAQCDGPEDCPGGLICCASLTTGAACAASCDDGAQTLCRSDADCDGTACTTCPVPLVGELSVCADDCTGVP